MKKPKSVELMLIVISKLDFLHYQSLLLTQPVYKSRVVGQLFFDYFALSVQLVDQLIRTFFAQWMVYVCVGRHHVE